jgi:hypothetical protein
VAPVRNISKSPIAVRDKRQPGEPEDVDVEAVKVNPGKTIEVSEDQANELVRDYPEHFERA